MYHQVFSGPVSPGRGGTPIALNTVGTVCFLDWKLTLSRQAQGESLFKMLINPKNVGDQKSPRNNLLLHGIKKGKKPDMAT